MNTNPEAKLTLQSYADFVCLGFGADWTQVGNVDLSLHSVLDPIIAVE